MRALGPESVSSFLKIAVDVVYAAACVAAATRRERLQVR